MSLKPKILFIGDPLSSLKLSSDTSIAFCETALNLDFEVFWCEKKDISYFNYEILVNNCFVIKEASMDSLKYDAFGSGSIPFSEFNHCFIRPNPPFDDSYKDLCWILNTQTKVKMCNAPSALLDFHEKIFQFRAFSEGGLEEKNLIPTCVSESSDIIKEFLNVQSQNGVKKFITKPWLGYAGGDVMLWHDAHNLIHHVNVSKHKLIVQPFLDEIHVVGDRRVLFVNGKVWCSFVRIPPKEGVASNLAQGGFGVLRDMTSAQHTLCQKIGSFLLKHSISLAGVDLIGEKVGEINITSPTGFRFYESVSGTRVTKEAFETIILKK